MRQIAANLRLTPVAVAHSAEVASAFSARLGDGGESAISCMGSYDFSLDFTAVVETPLLEGETAFASRRRMRMGFARTLREAYAVRHSIDTSLPRHLFTNLSHRDSVRDPSS